MPFGGKRLVKKLSVFFVCLFFLEFISYLVLYLFLIVVTSTDKGKKPPNLGCIHEVIKFITAHMIFTGDLDP